MCHQRNVLHCCEPILPKYQTNFIGHSLLQKIVENTHFCRWFLLPIFISYFLQKMAHNIFGEYERNILAFSVYFCDYDNLYFGLKPRFQRQNIISENSHHALHYRLRPIKEVQFGFAHFMSHFIRVQIFQIDFPLILSASKFFRYFPLSF